MSGTFDFLALLCSRWRILAAAPLLGAALAAAGSFALTPLFTARTVLIPPQQPTTASSALASLGALGNIAGALPGVKSSADQFASLLGSANVQEPLIERFKLVEVYQVERRYEVRRMLEKRVRISLGKRDGLITVEVDDADPQRAAALANGHVAELKRLSTELAITEAQQRRAFFEVELKQTQTTLMKAQEQLQASGFNAGVLRAEPKAAAESYARLKVEATASEVRLRMLRAQLTESAPELRMQQAQVDALRSELRKLERASAVEGNSDYLGLYREYKYQEVLFEQLSRQFELARLDEAREGALIQVVDVAVPPEIKSWPRRSLVAAAGAALGLVTAVLWVLSLPLRQR